jgi:translation initiation factor 4G
MVTHSAHSLQRQAFNQRKNFGRDDPFVPLWQKDKSRQYSRQKSHDKQQKARKVIQPVQEPVQIKRSESAWLPSSQRTVEIDDKDKEVVRKARGILNKLTPEKFQTLTEQMLQLDITTEERLRRVIDLIFEKALSEPSFSVAYANLCAVLMKLKVSIGEQSEAEGAQPVVNLSFRKVLLTRCQKEFEKDKEVPTKQEMQEMIDACKTEVEKATKKEELDMMEFKARKRSLGNIRFIGELFKLGLLTEAIMHECFMKLLKKSEDHESLECMCRLMTTVGKSMDSSKAKVSKLQYIDVRVLYNLALLSGAI